jgi:hypothetical protein
METQPRKKMKENFCKCLDERYGHGQRNSQVATKDIWSKKEK